MKRIFTLLFILISIIGYSQEQKQDYIKVDPLSLGIQTTTITVKTRDEIEQKIDEYNRRLEGLFMEREEWVKLLDQCDKLQIVTPKDTITQIVQDSVSSSVLGVGKLKITNLHSGTVGGPEQGLKFSSSGETIKSKKNKKIITK